MKSIVAAAVVLIGLVAAWTILERWPSDDRLERRETTTADEYVVDPSDLLGADGIAAGGPQSSAVDADEKKWLVLMREEEKLARDVYTTLGGKWGLNVFFNIAASEQAHTESVKILLDRYGIQDPSTDDTVGVFASPTMQKLYNELTTKGNQSLPDALAVGATIEDLDIRDLDNALAETGRSDIIQVYKNLQKGSRNHMRAFVRNIESRGGSYAPQYISEEAFEDIISSPQERGRI